MQTTLPSAAWDFIDASSKAFNLVLEGLECMEEKLPPDIDPALLEKIKGVTNSLIDPFTDPLSFLNPKSSCSLHKEWPIFCRLRNSDKGSKLHRQLANYVRGDKSDFLLGHVAALMAIESIVIGSVPPKEFTVPFNPEMQNLLGTLVSRAILGDGWGDHRYLSSFDAYRDYQGGTLGSLFNAHREVMGLLNIAWKMDDALPEKGLILEALSNVLPDVTPWAGANYFFPELKGLDSLQVKYIGGFFRMQRIITEVLHAIDLYHEPLGNFAHVHRFQELFDVVHDEDLMSAICASSILFAEASDDARGNHKVQAIKTTLDPTRGSFLTFLMVFSQEVASLAADRLEVLHVSGDDDPISKGWKKFLQALNSQLRKAQKKISVAIEDVGQLKAMQVPQNAQWIKQLLLNEGLGIVLDE